MSTSTQDNHSAESISLVVDASTCPLHVGIPSSNGWESLIIEKAQALEGLFLAIQKVLVDSRKKISQINRVYFCEGPGSTLGLRLAAAFVKTLRWSNSSTDFEVFSYNALDIAAYLAPEKNAVIQAPFRIGSRFVRIPHQDPSKSQKKIVAEDDALTSHPQSFHLPDLRKRSKPVDPDKTLVYDLSKIKGISDLKPISKLCTEIATFNPRAAEFKKWAPRPLPG